MTKDVRSAYIDELNSLMYGSAMARDILASDFSNLTAEEELEVRMDAVAYLEQADNLLKLLDEGDEIAKRVAAQVSLVDVAKSGFWGHSIGKKIRFIIFVIPSMLLLKCLNKGNA